MKLITIAQTEHIVYIFLEYCNEVTLEDYIKKSGGKLN